ncbi:MAG: HlyD family efflux transporter periplasmic adaptor subunit [Thiomargarita sp.]|nr:HlyD family efflux transporter periplasmic adaptor subunit [Thiomargarita sp.]
MKKILLPLFILLISFLVFKYMQATTSGKRSIKIEEQTWVVEVLTVKPDIISPSLNLYGRVESPTTVILRTASQSLNVNARIKQISVLEGHYVKNGQLLIQLENQDIQLNLKQKQADVTDINAQIKLQKQRYQHNLAALTHEKKLLNLKQKSLTRLQNLNKKQISSQATLDESQQAVEQQKLALLNRQLEIKNYAINLTQLQAKHKRAIAQRDLINLELMRTKITAPFDGIIAELMVAKTNRVRSGDALLSIYDTTSLEVRAQIPSRYQHIILAALETNYKLEAFAQLDNQQIKLQLDRLSGQINADSGGIDGLFSLNTGENNLRLGQFLYLTLNLPAQTNIIILPFEAIYGANRVYKLVDGRMQGITIERLGEQASSGKESLLLVRSSDLQAGDQVIITHLPNAINGLKVKVNLEL